MKGFLLALGFVLGVCLVAVPVAMLMRAQPDYVVVDDGLGIYYRAGDTSLSRVYFVRGGPGAYPQLLYVALLSVDGVKAVDPEPYDYVVTISRCYRWDEVHPLVVDRLRKWIVEEYPVLTGNGGENKPDGGERKGAA